MNNKSNIFKNIIIVLLTLFVLGLAIGTMSASTPAGTGADTGSNVTLNATNATGIPTSVNTIAGANITVYFNTTNASATIWNINATNLSVSINGSGSPNGTIAGNGTFILNSSVSTPWFNVTVTNAGNSSENATLTRFYFVAPIDLGNASSFAILSSTFTNTNPTVINGDVGYTVAGAPTDPPTVNGDLHPEDATRAEAGTNQDTALAALDSKTCTFTFATGAIDLAADITHGPIGVYTPGVYCIGGAVSIGTAGINLSGAGTYIFRSTGALTTIADSNVTLINGASASDVFWTPVATTLGADTIFSGTVIQTATPITVLSNVDWTGRALAFANTVTTGANVVITSPSFSVAGLNFVTTLPIRMLNETGAPTKIPTRVYYYYNGSTIRINVSLNQQHLNVSGTFSPLNTSLINTSTNFTNATGEYVYTLTARAGNVSMGAYPIVITAINTTGATRVSTIPIIALMNINPQVIDPTLGGTNWTTDIADFTNATLTFEKYNDTAHTSRIGRLEFLTPMNLADNTTATALRDLGTNLNMNGTFMNLNSSASALGAMNVSSNLSFYNLSMYFGGKRASILINGVPAIRSDLAQVGDITVNTANVTWSTDNSTVNFTTSHWSNISLQSFRVNFTNITVLSQITNASVNATYSLLLQNNGTAADSYNLTIDSGGASTAALNVSGNISLAVNASRTLLLNITNSTAGIFYVNVTARSNNDTTQFRSFNTTTTVNPTNGTNLTNISLLAQTVFLSTNATYTFRIHNNGSLTDNYTINISSNPNNATVGLNITLVEIPYGETRLFTLNVSNVSSGIFRVNITVNSTNDPSKWGYANTTTNVTTVAGSTRGAVDLGTAGDFVILSKTGITNVHTSHITGDIGSSPITAAAMDEVFCSEITGTIYGANAAYTGSSDVTCFAGTAPDITYVATAVLDMGTAYTAAAGRTLPDATELYAGNIGGRTLAPGLYKWSTDVTIPTDVTLSGGADDVWIFQIAGNLDIAAGGSVPSGIKIILTGGAQASNVFWQVGGGTGATLGTYSTFNGNILSAKQVIINTGAVLNGRALADSQVTLQANTIGNPTSPTVISTTPVDLATGVANNSAMTATFSKDMNQSTVTNVTFTLNNGSTPVPGNVTYSGVTATFRPGSNLTANTTYTAMITTGVKDLFGNALVSNYTWNFTAGAPDIISPTVNDRFPAINAMGVSNNSVMTATFSEVLNQSTVTNVTFTLTNGSTHVPGNVTYFNITATFTPGSTLTNNTTYTAMITTGVRDLAGNALASNYTWNFTAGATPDSTRPNVSSTIPVNLSTGVDISSTITATFTEVMSASTINTGTFTLKQGLTAVPGNLTYSTVTATFRPASNLAADTTYTATITAGAKDLAGNLAVTKVWTFTTAATTTTTTTSSGGGGSSSGGGVVTSEPYENIAKSERYDKNLIANTSVTYVFKLPELSVYEIAVTGKENENDITLRLELLKGTSKLVTVQAPGIVYKNLNVWAGTQRIKEYIIGFRVENSWLTSNSLTGSNIKIVKWDGSKWVQIETMEKTKDDTYTSFEAKTDAISMFAITGLKEGIIVPSATQAGAVTGTPAKPAGTTAPAPTTTKKSPGFELEFVGAVLCSLYLFSRNRR